MKTSKLTIFFILSLILLLPAKPSQAESYRAGTDDYLVQELHYTDEMLAAEYETEKREAFDIYDGEGLVEDPFGDVLSRLGTRQFIQAPWGDIKSAELIKNTENESWDIIIKTGGLIPPEPSGKVQFIIAMDSDNNTDNNDTDGIRVNTDSEFSLQFNEENGWYADYRWYNTEADFWGLDKETDSEFYIAKDTVTYNIPFSEVIADTTPKWRVLTAIQDGQDTQIDSAPTTGFPAPLDSETETKTALKKFEFPPITAVSVIIIIAAVLAIVYIGWIVYKDKK